MWLLQWCLLVQILFSRAAYYHELSMVTIEPPGPLHSDAFFGYGISYYGDRLIASAPRADINGQVFSCPLDKSDTKHCTQMFAALSGVRVDDKKNRHNHNFWLGATLKANKRKLFVCAPRTTSNIPLEEGGTKVHFGTAGQCYVAEGSGNFTDLTQISTDERKIGYVQDRFENMTDSFGWSMDVEEKILRVGSPALAAGRAMTYSDASPAVTPKVFLSPNKNGFNFGYSIASGYFLRSARKPGVAIGTPYGDYGVGKVMFFDDKQTLLFAVDDPSGKVGALFGAALCAADISWTTYLFVGAPAHFTGDGYHTGIVYMYWQDEKYMRVFREIEGPNKYGSFFGHAIANVGDVDHDKKEEIVIAAPYEDDGRGAVYLYAGSMLSSAEKKIKWIQRFQPKTPVFWNLGLSLTANKYSDNGCYDLAIGAPGNDKVAVYRCLTVITVNLVTDFPNLQTRSDKTKFVFKSCLKPVFPDKPKHIQAKFRVKVKITHPNATLANAKGSNDYEEYEEIIDKSNSNFCQEIPVTTPVDGHYDQEIQFDITATLLDDPVLSTEFDPSTATVSKQSSLSLGKSVRAAECKHEPCQPDLKVELTTSMKEPYVIGSTETETVEVVVRNEDGDTAYRPCVRVLVEGEATLTHALHCAFVDQRQTTCQLQRPLMKNSSWDVTSSQKLVLDLTSLTSKSSDLKITAEVYNRCDIDKKADDNMILKRELTIDSSAVRIDSKTDQGEEVFFNRYDVDNGKTLYHTYTIANTGGTNWLDLYCDIVLYKRPYIRFTNTFQIYSGDTARKPCELSKHSDSAEFLFVSCPIGDLHRKKTITVVIAMTSIPAALDKIFKESNGTAETYVKIKFDETHVLEKYEKTILLLQEARVPWYIILAAGAVGFLIVLLIAFALYECGFLRRQNKKKLEQLQNEVKRKSAMLQRQSMRLTESARADLRNRPYRELLDEAEIKEIEESIEDKEDNASNSRETSKIPETDNTPKTDQTKPNQETAKPKACTTTPLNGNSSVSNLDLRAQIERSLQKQNKGSDKIPLYKENEI